MRPLGVGDTVKVLRAVRLPREEVLGIGPIERISRATSGESLYWVRGFACARTERELRRWTSMAEAEAIRDDERYEEDMGTVRCLDCGWDVPLGSPCGRCGLGADN